MTDYSDMPDALRADAESGDTDAMVSALFVAADAIEELIDTIKQMMEDAEDQGNIIVHYESCLEDILYYTKKAMRGSE